MKGNRRIDGAGPPNRDADTLARQASRVVATTERHWSAAAIAIALFGFGALLVVLPRFFQSFDEAKYVGIGRNVLAGRGVVTIDGTAFLEHSPLWSVAIVLPSLVLGGDPLDWGHAYNVLAGLAFVALVAAFGWRVRPAAGALAAAVIVGFVYLHDLSRTARLDVPVAALTLAAVAVGLRAFERRSPAGAAAAGFVFGLAGLVKEVVLPFAPLPLLAALLRGVPGRTVVRLGGVMALTALATTAWWFVVVASYTGRIYRLGLPASILGPLLVAVAAASIAAIAVEHLAGLAVIRRLRAVFPRRVPGMAPDGGTDAGPGGAGAARALGVGGATLAWFALQLVFYARSPDARLPNLLNLEQLRVYGATWAPALGLVAGFVGGGVAILVVEWLRRRRRVGAAGDPVGPANLELAVAVVCGAPLVLLVATLGEPPRNYLAEIGLAVALAAGGWIRLAEMVAERGRVAWLGAGAATGLAAGLALVAVRIPPLLALPAGVAGGIVAGAIGRLGFQRWSLLRRGWPAVTAAVAACLFVGALGVYAVGHRESAGGRARAEIVASVVAWVRSNVPPGSTVALGSLLGYEIGNELVGDYRVVRITQTSARVDPRAPLGVAPPAGGTIDDWIALDPAPRNTAELAAFRSSSIIDRLRRTGAVVWIYVTGTDTAAPTVLAALSPEHGFTATARFVAPTTPTSPPIEAVVLRIDPGRLDLPSDRLYVAPAALERLVAGLQTANPPPRDVAARLLERIVVVPAGAEGQLLDALRTLAGEAVSSP